MSTIVIERGLTEQLTGLRDVTELRDHAGQLVGHFLPPTPICPWEPELTAEELQKRRQAGGGKPLNEIVRRLTGR